MIIAKLSKCHLERSDTPKNHSIYRLNNKEYYIGNGEYRKRDTLQQLKPDLRYLLAIESEINDEVMYIKNDFYLLAFDDKYNLVDEVKVTGDVMYAQYNANLKEIIMWQLLTSLDFDSVEGRKIAYLNYNCNYDYRLNNIPHELTIPTKKYNAKFTFESNDQSKDAIEYVLLENVVGSTHGRYEGSPWFEIFINLKRSRTIVESLVYPEYYKKLESEEIQPEQLSFIKVDDDYFVDTGAHRVTIAKLKGIKGMLAPVRKLKTSNFHKNYFEKISALGFDVSLAGDIDSYYNTLTGLDNKYDWEVFKIRLNNSSVYLYNEEMIMEFYNTFNVLNTSDRAIKFNQFRRTLMKIRSLFINHKKDQDEAWYEKYVTNGVKYFFFNNYLALSDHKKRLIQYSDKA